MIKLLLVLLCVFGWKCEGNCNPDPSSTWTAPPGWVICQIKIKAGPTTWVFTADECQDGYCVSGIGSQTATAWRACGESPLCKEISHTEYWQAQAQPVPTIPSPTATATTSFTPTPDPTEDPTATPTPLVETPEPETPVPTSTYVHRDPDPKLTPYPYPTPRAVPVTGGGPPWQGTAPVLAILILFALAAIWSTKRG